MRHKRFLAGFGNGCPPDEIHVEVYFLQQGSTAREAASFFAITKYSYGKM